MNDRIITFHATEDANGKFVIAAWQNGPTARFFAPSQVLSSPKFGQSSSALYGATSILALGANRAVATLNVNGWKERAPKDAAALTGPFKAVQKAGIEARVENDRWRAKWLSKRSVEPTTAAEIRSWLRGQKADAATRAALEDPDVAAAALNAWALSGVPASLRPQVEDTLIRANLANAYSDQMTVKPTAASPLQYGADHEAIRRMMADAIVQHEAARAEVDLVETVLHSAINFVAVAADVHREQAYQLLAA